MVKRRVDKITSSRNGQPTQSGSQPKAGSGLKRKAAEDSDDENESSKRNVRDQNSDRKSQSNGHKKDKKRGKSGKSDDAIAKSPSDVAPPSENREKRGLEKLGDHLGSLIGRKRKQRKIR